MADFHSSLPGNEGFDAPDPDFQAGGESFDGDELIETKARQLVLVKKGQRYVFRYQEGGEAQLLSHLVELVQQDESDLDWFDAAVLSHQMGQRLSCKLDRMLK
jgi:hypothetical protein